MATLLFGDRIGRTAKLSPAVSGFIFSHDRQRLLLTRRTDNGRWCVPGGRLEPGESLGEAAVREVREETGLETRVVGLLGAGSDPHVIYTYPDGNRWQGIEIDLELALVDGHYAPTDEVSQIGYFALDELGGIDLMEIERERVRAALAGGGPYLK